MIYDFYILNIELLEMGELIVFWVTKQKQQLHQSIKQFPHTCLAETLLIRNLYEPFFQFTINLLNFFLIICSVNLMQNSQLLSPKRQHYNRFAYLLESNNDKQKQKIQKEFNFFSIDNCTQNLCKSQQQKTQVKQEQTMTSSVIPNTRKPLKYELQSPNYKLFKNQINPKPSLKSFLAYTPEKSQIKDQFSIYNDISTIEYTKSNQMHTHRNLFESILEQETEKMGVFLSEQMTKQVRHLWRTDTENQEDFQAVARAKPYENELIKLQLSESNDNESQHSQTHYIKKHLRTMTQGNEQYHSNHQQKPANPPKIQPSMRFTQFIHKTQLQSIQVSEPSKNDSIEYSSIPQALKDKKYTGVTMTTLKTKKMSQKLQQSSDLEYNNSISVSLKNSQSSEGFKSHKSIRLGRRTGNKL